MTTSPSTNGTTPAALPCARLFKCLEIALLLCSIAFLGGIIRGQVATAVMLVLVALSLTLLSRRELAAYGFLVGGSVLGAVLGSYGVHGVGLPIVMGISVLLAADYLRDKRLSYMRPAMWLLIVMGIFLFSYFNGPQSAYSFDKLVSIPIGIVTTGLGWVVIMSSDSFNMRRFGVVCLASALAIATLILTSHGGAGFDASFLRLGAFREVAKAAGFGSSYKSAANMACLSGVFIILAYFRKTKGVAPLLLSLYGCCLLVLLVFGERLYIAAMLIAFAFEALRGWRRRHNNRTRSVAVGIVVVIMLVAFVTTDNPLVDQVVGGESFGARVNRSTNWDAAVQIVDEKYIWGHGLGGYYIPERTEPGAGYYPHNIVLELIIETGVVNTIILIVVSGLLLFAGRRNGSQSVVPIGLFILVRIIVAMISHDLGTNMALFGIICAWAVVTQGKGRYGYAASSGSQRVMRRREVQPRRGTGVAGGY